ncbi:unnamed protein product [Periconia digitata]|uniref:Uncharacterized protein n=1 Tax=Periconia digitata TaxID=1303443 RepID=A0A9W4U6W0_9PLEO|nr:unnamed protein product [Periconia digitata]
MSSIDPSTILKLKAEDHLSYATTKLKGFRITEVGKDDSDKRAKEQLTEILHNTVEAMRAAGLERKAETEDQGTDTGTVVQDKPTQFAIAISDATETLSITYSIEKNSWVSKE